MKTLHQLLASLSWSATGETIQKDDLPVWCDYTGQNESEVQKWGWLNAIHSEDHKQIRYAWDNSIKHKSSFHLKYHIRENNSTYHYFMVSHVPVFSSENSLISWTCIFTNITNYTPVRDEEIEGRFFSQLMFDRAAIGIFHLSLDGYILRVNKEFCHIVGYSEAELQNSSICILETEHDFNTCIRYFSQLLLKQARSVEIRMRYIRKDGSFVWVKLSAALIYLPSGELNSYLVMVDDITAEVQAEQKHRQMEEHVQQTYQALLTWAEEIVQLPTKFESHIHKNVSSLAFLRKRGISSGYSYQTDP